MEITINVSFIFSIHCVSFKGQSRIDTPRTASAHISYVSYNNATAQFSSANKQKSLSKDGKKKGNIYRTIAADSTFFFLGFLL